MRSLIRIEPILKPDPWDPKVRISESLYTRPEHVEHAHRGALHRVVGQHLFLL